MIYKDLTGTINDIRKTIEGMAGRNLAMVVATTAGLGIAAGMLLGHMSGKKTRDKLKNRKANAVITIEVFDLDQLRIEKID